ncbi:hypothetical protein AQUCO_01000492v1 [Aquilegia coerulea]|uniref:Uncharacterized protein n=1 Tax=Aquilegia coerulea TaxID=218851 RepID=A0A2G5EAQ5_AQUCA|nr:hypothetical protein AQUCO_01000492v1 [Aquilegia coerulea]
MTPVVVAAAVAGGGGARLISSTLSHTTTHSPLTLSSQTPLSPPQPQLLRRNAVVSISLLSLFPFLSQPSPASAFSIGISGPKDWLREQKKKASRFLLAPIDASRDYLQTAYLILKESDSNDSNKDLDEVQRLMRSAARDCIIEDRNSVVSFQAKTGVEVCTFRLIVNNAASLLDNKDPVKLEAEAMLADLVRSFTMLGGVTNEADLQLASSRQKVSDALMDTIFSLEKFEQGIKDCLEV